MKFDMKSFKPIFTIFVIYQIVMILILYGDSHSYGDICASLFSYKFCNNYGFPKYFIMCFTIPLAIGFAYWWRKELGLQKLCRWLARPMPIESD